VTWENPGMRIVQRRGPGGPEQVTVEEAPRPQPAADEALVRVHAAAITRDELTWPADHFPVIPSYELAGVVEEIGSDVSGLAPGDEVFALAVFHRDGVAADYTAQPAALLVGRPQTIGRAESAATPLPALSAWQGLFDHGRLEPGERVLIQGATGAVGAFAVQFARAHGAQVIATASASNLERARELGADDVVDAAADPTDSVHDIDLVFDTVGGEGLRRSGEVLRAGGRVVSVAEPPPGAGIFFIVEPNHDQLASIARLLDDGRLRPPPVEILPLADAREAFARSLERGRRGKVVLAAV
jgi:NADPH:quinone reductase-like Zn-dependent oxidoreductase